MAITIIFGAPGAGKTSLMTHMLVQIYRREGRRLLKACRGKIEAENRERAHKLTLPDKPPIFSNFKVRLLDGYENFYEPYFINGFYFGIENENMPTQFILPESKIFLDEAQGYFDSRKSGSFPRWVSEAFEKHRQYGIDLYLGVQRARLIDLNIRGLCKRFIEVREMESEQTETGRVVSSTFRCREWDSVQALESYLDSGAQSYRETSYLHRGNIRKVFDSFAHFKDFLPSDGKDFNLLPFLSKGEKAPKEAEIYYKLSEPKEYRSQEGQKKKEKEKRADV